MHTLVITGNCFIILCLALTLYISSLINNWANIYEFIEYQNIGNIIRNPAYTGRLVQGKKYVTIVNGERRYRLNKGERQIGHLNSSFFSFSSKYFLIQS